MTKQEFINEVYKYLKKYAKNYNILCLSVPIAQACKESAFGTSELAINANNFFGLKYKESVSGPNFYIKNAVEQRKDGTYYNVSGTKWCKFNSFEEGVKGYLDFINNSRYSNLKGVKDYTTYINNIKADGYCTSLTYVNSIINDYILMYDLLKFDKEEDDKKMEIIKCLSTHNTSSKPNRNIEFLVIHYTAGTTSKKGTARNVANYFATTQNQASADFIVDDEEIVQYNADILNRYCWSVGGNKYNSMTTSKGAEFYKKCMNNNSISIEICSSKINKSSLKASDTDWFFTDSVLNNAVELTKYLMKEFNISINRVIMHHQVNGKVCPNPFCVNEAALSNWYNFLENVEGTSYKEVVNNNNNTTITYINYTVIRGDSLNKIAAKYNVKVEDIVKINNINNPNLIRVGQIIKIPTIKEKDFKVKVSIPDLNIRRGPGTNYPSRGFTGVGIFTVVDTEGDWYLLKSFSKNRDGWVHKNYCKKLEA